MLLLSEWTLVFLTTTTTTAAATTTTTATTRTNEKVRGKNRVIFEESRLIRKLIRNIILKLKKLKSQDLGKPVIAGNA